MGDLRFNLPVAVDAYTGTQTVTSFGPACPQQAFDFPTIPGLAGDVVDWFVNTIYNVITPSAEDCEFPFSDATYCIECRSAGAVTCPFCADAFVVRTSKASRLTLLCPPAPRLVRTSRSRS